MWFIILGYTNMFLFYFIIISCLLFQSKKKELTYYFNITLWY